jgi:hypothetical protein
MPTAANNHPLFGPVTFRTKHDTWVFGDDITFISGFDVNDITTVYVPELQGIHGANNGNVRFHNKGHAQLKAAFGDVAAQNKLSVIKTFGDSLNFRLRRPISGNLSKLPSNHAFGIALDLNEDDGTDGGSVTPIAPILQQHGFIWGRSFNDPMHFEIGRFLS